MLCVFLDWLILTHNDLYDGLLFLHTSHMPVRRQTRLGTTQDICAMLRLEAEISKGVPPLLPPPLRVLSLSCELEAVALALEDVELAASTMLDPMPDKRDCVRVAEGFRVGSAS